MASSFYILSLFSIKFQKNHTSFLFLHKSDIICTNRFVKECLTTVAAKLSIPEPKQP